jgi:formate hydrogenlyase subunit 6/NADH:ubiquinone oxidoreductase subunit I
MVPRWVDFLAKKVFVKTPKFSARKCKSCGRCEQICPAHIINLEGRHGTAQLIDKTKCLHCFCCHEICSFGAIKLRRF